MQRMFRLVMLSVVLTALTLMSGQAAAREAAYSPASGPCAPGASYDPACDVDHDGDVDVIDVQLAAGHWNQTGAWVSDNGHDHLGQTWTGTTPLRLTGSYGPPTYAPLVLGNSYSTGDGLLVEPVTTNGVTLQGAGVNGVHLMTAGLHGYFVHSAGANGVYVYSAGANGMRVDAAATNGLYIGSAGSNGVYVGSAGAHGVYAVTTNSAYHGVYGINSGGGNGMRGDSNGAITSGVYGENTGGGFGVAGRVINGGRAVYGEGGSGWAGWFNGNVTITGTCSGCRLANFAINAGSRALQPGDVVAVIGVTTAEIDNAPRLWDVAPAEPGQAAVGVVAGGADLLTAAAHLPTESGRQLVPREGAAAPGDYVQVVYSGPVQVRLAPGAQASTGARVTPAAGGRVRPLQTRTVEGMVVTEGTPTLGVVLSEATDGVIWVLVNPQ